MHYQHSHISWIFVFVQRLSRTSMSLSRHGLGRSSYVAAKSRTDPPTVSSPLPNALFKYCRFLAIDLCNCTYSASAEFTFVSQGGLIPRLRSISVIDILSTMWIPSSHSQFILSLLLSPFFIQSFLVNSFQTARLGTTCTVRHGSPSLKSCPI
jgi:hypothetical protein